MHLPCTSACMHVAIKTISLNALCNHTIQTLRRVSGAQLTLHTSAPGTREYKSFVKFGMSSGFYKAAAFFCFKAGNKKAGVWKANDGSLES